MIPRNVLEWRADPACDFHDPRLSHRTGPLMLICAEGYQSSLAAATLHDLGITDATDVIRRLRRLARSRIAGAKHLELTDPS